MALKELRKPQLFKESLQVSQKKLDPDSFDFWYFEAKKQLKQVFLEKFAFFPHFCEF